MADVNNLSASLNSGMNSALVQRIDSQSPFNINLAISRIWINISRDEQQGPLADISGFGFPLLHLEIGLPSDFHLIARGMVFNLGKPTRERALLWGIGGRYVMLHQQKDSRINAGIIVMYGELTNLDDFHIQSFLVDAYLGGGPKKLNMYISPGLIRSWYYLHLDNSENGEPGLQDTRIFTFLKLKGGILYNLTSHLTFTGNIVFGEFMAFSVGWNITLF